MRRVRGDAEQFHNISMALFSHPRVHLSVPGFVCGFIHASVSVSVSVFLSGSASLRFPVSAPTCLQHGVVYTRSSWTDGLAILLCSSAIAGVLGLANRPACSVLVPMTSALTPILASLPLKFG